MVEVEIIRIFQEKLNFYPKSKTLSFNFKLINNKTWNQFPKLFQTFHSKYETEMISGVKCGEAWSSNP